MRCCSANHQRRTAQDPLVHHGRHFGRVAHAFCNVQALLMNGMILMGEIEENGRDSLTAQ